MKSTGRSLMGLGVIALLAVAIGTAGCKSSSDQARAQEKNDARLTDAVKQELASDPIYKFPEVQPVVHAGVVQLAGFVDTPAQRQHAADLAGRTAGVSQVINSLELRRSPTGRADIYDRFNNTAAPPPPTPAPPAPQSGAPNPQPAPTQ